jgi:hypothetical protein
MKESKFIELLNLYVDHQINPDDAALLESEVQSNPGRRRIYRQYCQMQKACAEMSATFCNEAPATSPRIAEFEPRRRAAGRMAYAAGFSAVAACLALAFVLRSHVNVGQPAGLSATSPHGQLVAQASSPLTPSNLARPALKPAFGPGLLKLREQNAELADASTATDQASFGGWMNSVQLSSMDGATIDDLRFDGHPALRPDNPANRTVRPFQGKVEMAAVRFQK